MSRAAQCSGRPRGASLPPCPPSCINTASWCSHTVLSAQSYPVASVFSSVTAPVVFLPADSRPEKCFSIIYRIAVGDKMSVSQWCRGIWNCLLSLRKHQGRGPFIWQIPSLERMFSSTLGVTLPTDLSILRGAEEDSSTCSLYFLYSHNDQEGNH